MKIMRLFLTSFHRQSSLNVLRMVSNFCFFFVLVGCGTVSTLKAPDSAVRPDLKGYDTIVVNDFQSAVDTTFSDRMKQRDFDSKVEFTQKDIADKIAYQLEFHKIFDTVLREVPAYVDEETLILNGLITRFVEGNSMARLMVGFGVGSSYFDAVVRLRNSDKRLVGEIKVDKNSWVLGGGLASAQTVDVFVKQAVEKIVRELEESKNFEGIQPDKPKKSEVAKKRKSRGPGGRR